MPTTTGLELALGAYQGGTAGSVVAGHKKQMIISGEYNTGTNVGSSVKLLISDYDNQTGGGSDIYPIYVEDENNFVDFYVRKQEKVSSAYFGGDLIVKDDLEVGGSLRIGYKTGFSGGWGAASAHCSQNRKVLGGGCTPIDLTSPVIVSIPFEHGWYCDVEGQGWVEAYAICARLD